MCGAYVYVHANYLVSPIGFRCAGCLAPAVAAVAVPQAPTISMGHGNFRVPQRAQLRLVDGGK